MTRTKLFTVQFFARRDTRLVATGALYFSHADLALRVADDQAPSRTGVAVLEFTGVAQLAAWDPPRLLAAHGEIPAHLAEGSI